jgi:molybdenum ABC transporter molybdate-binding protein
MDLHGDPASADLVLFVGGNQWMVMPSLIAAFRASHPEVRSVFYETLPPGILAKQLRAGALEVGELTISARADVYMSGGRRMALERDSGVVGSPTAYASNELAIVVASGNAKHIAALRDLARTDVRVAMPNPKWEGIGRQIESAYRRAGGEALVHQIVDVKVANGTTRLTRIHHRETPAWIRSGSVDAGVVWLTEALYQQRIKSGVVTVLIPESQNEHAEYEAAVVANAPHSAAAHAFVAFLSSAAGQAVYRSYGFAAPVAAKE